MNRFELMKMRAENVRSSFSASSIIFGSMVGFLIAAGLQGRSFTITDTILLALWLFTFAGVAHNLLKIAEDIVWHVSWKSNLFVLICILVPAILIGFYQDIVPIDGKLWAALIPSWIASVLLTAFIERPTSKDLAENG